MERVWSKTACGLETWEGGALTTIRQRVTCADCLAALKPEAAPVIALEPIAYVVHHPKATPAKVLRKKTGDSPSTIKPQSGFEFGGTL